jgi:RNA polymerase sigma-70 factor (ECF subfamily)
MVSMEDEAGSTRWSLIGRLKNWDDRTGWQQFFDGYWKLIYRTATRAGLTESEAQEVVQETILSVAKGMKDFQADPSFGSFKGWLLLITRRRITDQLRKRKPEEWSPPREKEEAGTGTGTTDRIPDPGPQQWEKVWEEEWQKNVADAALESIKQQVNPKQYKIFYLHVMKQQSARAVRQALGVNIGQVYLAKHRISSLLKKEVKRQQKLLEQASPTPPPERSAGT